MIGRCEFKKVLEEEEIATHFFPIYIRPFHLPGAVLIVFVELHVSLIYFIYLVWTELSLNAAGLKLLCQNHVPYFGCSVHFVTERIALNFHFTLKTFHIYCCNFYH